MSCLHPLILGRRLVPCGKCVLCRKRRITDWSLRLQLEARDYSSSDMCFLTLTYNDEHLPSGGLLSIRDVQLFLKRLRKHLHKYYNRKIRYFCAGEYGGKNGRPHYHLLIFGIGIKFADLIERCWHDFGFINCKSVHSSHFYYVAKYCVKKFNVERVNKLTGEVLSEFTLMSRRKMIGYSSISTYDNAFDLITNGFVKINDFTYSVPKSFLQYLDRHYGLKRDKSRIVVYFNDKMFDKLDFISYFNNSIIGIDDELKELYLIKEYDVDFVPFSKLKYEVDFSKKLAYQFIFKRKYNLQNYSSQFVKSDNLINFFYEYFTHFYKLI